MDFPFVFQLGQVSINVHLLFELSAYFIGFRYFLYLRGRQVDPISSENRLWVFIGAAAGAFVGSRFLGALENPEWFFSGEKGLLYYYQSKTIIGGLLGGLIGVELIKKMIGETRSSGDLFVFPLILAMAIGRIGCFSMGIHEPTYGTPSELPWAMDLGDGIHRHPTALYEIVFLVVLWCILIYTKNKNDLKNGALFKLFMAGYLIYRLLIGFIQPGWKFSFGLSVLQVAIIFGLVYYWKVLICPQSLLKK